MVTRRTSWTSLTGASLHRVADALSRIDEATWSAESRCEGWSVRDVAAHLVWRLDPSSARLVGRGVGTLLRGTPKVNDALARRDAGMSTAEIVSRLRDNASGFMAGGTRDTVFDLVEAVVHGYDMRIGVELSSGATHETAIARGRALPRRVLQVLGAEQLIARDAGWSIGHGSPVDATAEGIVLFVHGRTDSPVA